jgi:flagellar motor switch protein FliM
VDLTVSDFERLSVGDVLDMRKFDSVRVMVGDVPLFDADAGQANGYGAVKLSGSVELDAK